MDVYFYGDARSTHGLGAVHQLSRSNGTDSDVEKKKGSTQKGSDPAEGQGCLAIEMAGYRGFDLLMKLRQF